MKRYLIIIAGLILTVNLYGQSECGVSNLSQPDKILLGKFWIKFKNAVNASDKLELSTLVNFPFNCDHCIIDSLSHACQASIRVTKKQFDSNQYKIFFKKQLIEVVNRYQLPKDIFILTSNYNTYKKRCRYSFSYIAVKETKQYPGRQEWIDVEKINGQFKVVSSWTLP